MASISVFSSLFCKPTNKHKPLAIEFISCPSTKIINRCHTIYFNKLYILINFSNGSFIIKKNP